MRVGMGYDVHRLVENRKLILGGVEIPYEKGLLGHSDADVLVHAIMDALLGAAALGDIGKHFPDTDPNYEGISSIKLLTYVAELLEEVGPYQWYGNIRELQNFVERANILMRSSGASAVRVSDILRRRSDPAPEPRQEAESRDRSAIEAALRNHPGSMEDAARSLGCSRQTLWRKMKKYGIQR